MVIFVPDLVLSCWTRLWREIFEDNLCVALDLHQWVRLKYCRG
jgi:hypothetical protein